MENSLRFKTHEEMRQWHANRAREVHKKRIATGRKIYIETVPKKRK
jgi:hypothetical protein